MMIDMPERTAEILTEVRLICLVSVAASGTMF